MGIEVTTPILARTGMEGFGPIVLVLATPGFVSLLLAAVNLYLTRKVPQEDRPFHIDLLTVCASAGIVFIACVFAAMQSSSEIFIKTAALIYFCLPLILAVQFFALFSRRNRRK